MFQLVDIISSILSLSSGHICLCIVALDEAANQPYWQESSSLTHTHTFKRLISVTRFHISYMDGIELEVNSNRYYACHANTRGKNKSK
jgi:hypothetical protein